MKEKCCPACFGTYKDHANEEIGTMCEYPACKCHSKQSTEINYKQKFCSCIRAARFDGDSNCRVCGFLISNEEKQDWSERFDAEFVDRFMTADVENRPLKYPDYKEIKSFITSLLTQQKQEILGKVRGLKIPTAIPPLDPEQVPNYAYNTALKDVEGLLK